MTQAHQPSGWHVLADLYGVAPLLLADPVKIEAMLRAAAEAAGAHILAGHCHHFGEQQGVTGVLLLAESHISIHTWPEHGFAAVDIFMCGRAQPEAALRALTEALAATEARVSRNLRGVAD